MLVRADGSYLYSFTSVVDDLDFGYHACVPREVHVTNTGAQIHMFERWAALFPCSLICRCWSTRPAPA